MKTRTHTTLRAQEAVQKAAKAAQKAAQQCYSGVLPPSAAATHDRLPLTELHAAMDQTLRLAADWRLEG